MQSMAEKSRGGPSVLAFIASFLFAIVVWRPADGDSSVITFVVVWAAGYFVLLVLPSMWDALVLAARRRRR